jgi:hypothetical protein
LPRIDVHGHIVARSIEKATQIPRFPDSQCRPSLPPHYNGGMEKDFISDPEAFAMANEKAEVDYLESLTLERACEELEGILNFQAELVRTGEEMGLPPQLSNPLPGPTLAILLEGKPSAED